MIKQGIFQYVFMFDTCNFHHEKSSSIKYKNWIYCSLTNYLTEKNFGGTVI